MQPSPARFQPAVQPTFQPAPPMQNTPSAVPETKPKGPVPEEHMYLQTVFEELRNQCTCAANNPVSLRFYKRL